jgi:nucleoside-diphosphate-sugar epimerase
MEEKTILVTGATGLVGGHLLWHLLQKNETVHALKRSTSNLKPLRTIFSFYTNEPDIYLKKIIWLTADVLDKSSLIIAMKGIEVVYHCAAVVNLGNGSETMTDTNVRGTRNIVESALEMNIGKLCFVSSIAACGSAPMIDETITWVDNSHKSAYSRSKFYSEAEVWKGINAGLKAVIVNPGVILGVSGTSTGSSQIFAQVQKGLAFYTNGGSGYVDVQDVVKVMIRLVESDISGERFLLVSENCSNRDILSWMADGFGKRRPVIGIGKGLLYSVGLLLEVFGKLLGFTPLIDRGMALSATNREYYSAGKAETLLRYSFRPIKDCISEVCKFLSSKNI